MTLAGRGQPCQWCGEPIMPGDLVHSQLGNDMHYACAIRSVVGPVGHLEKKCTCYVKDGTAEHDPPGLTPRQAARLAADLWNSLYHHTRPGTH